jgi:hypothetical protein
VLQGIGLIIVAVFPGTVQWLVRVAG